MNYHNNDIQDYMNRLTPEQKEILIAHANTYQVEPTICAWYDNLDDFHEAWGEVSYTEDQADELLADESIEFIEFEDDQIIRLVL